MNFSYLVWEICDKHNIARRAGEQCAACAMEADRQQRDVLNVLEARISDQETDLLHLRTRVAQIEHILRDGGAFARKYQDLEDAHNKLVSYAESLDERLKEAESLLLSTLTRP